MEVYVGRASRGHKETERIHVSGGVIIGNILVKTTPQYPALPKSGPYPAFRHLREMP